MVSCLDRVRVRMDGRLVADHLRVWARNMTVTDPAHVASPASSAQSCNVPGSSKLSMTSLAISAPTTGRSGSTGRSCDGRRQEAHHRDCQTDPLPRRRVKSAAHHRNCRPPRRPSPWCAAGLTRTTTLPCSKEKPRRATRPGSGNGSVGPGPLNGTSTGEFLPAASAQFSSVTDTEGTRGHVASAKIDAATFIVPSIAHEVG
jgi:hypothetical protein